MHDDIVEEVQALVESLVSSRLNQVQRVLKHSTSRPSLFAFNPFSGKELEIIP